MANLRPRKKLPTPSDSVRLVVKYPGQPDGMQTPGPPARIDFSLEFSAPLPQKYDEGVQRAKSAAAWYVEEHERAHLLWFMRTLMVYSPDRKERKRWREAHQAEIERMTQDGSKELTDTQRLMVATFIAHVALLKVGSKPARARLEQAIHNITGKRFSSRQIRSVYEELKTPKKRTQR